MRAQTIRSCLTIAALALPLVAAGALAQPAGELAAAGNARGQIVAQMLMQPMPAPAVSPQAIADYRRRLKEYREARAAFAQQADAYWASIAEKRHGRYAKRRDHQPIALDDYVLTQPPLYAGPKRPVNPLPEPEPREPARERKYVPVVADLLKPPRNISSGGRSSPPTTWISSGPTPASPRAPD